MTLPRPLPVVEAVGALVLGARVRGRVMASSFLVTLGCWVAGRVGCGHRLSFEPG